MPTTMRLYIDDKPYLCGKCGGHRFIIDRVVGFTPPNAYLLVHYNLFICMRCNENAIWEHGANVYGVL